jgi:hypothetical protein
MYYWLHTTQRFVLAVGCRRLSFPIVVFLNVRLVVKRIGRQTKSLPEFGNVLAPEYESITAVTQDAKSDPRSFRKL